MSEMERVKALEEDMEVLMNHVDVIKGHLPLKDLQKLLNQEFSLLKLAPIIKKLKKVDFPAVNLAFDGLVEMYNKYKGVVSHGNSQER